jgi:hypothetical protein
MILQPHCFATIQVLGAVSAYLWQRVVAVAQNVAATSVVPVM